MEHDWKWDGLTGRSFCANCGAISETPAADEPCKPSSFTEDVSELDCPQGRISPMLEHINL